MSMRPQRRIVSAALAALFVSGIAQAAVITIPQSALIPSTTYYTDDIGGGIGSVLVMTGGGNAAGVGAASGRNDDGFSGPIPLGFSNPLSFFGNSYTQFWANNNGNISFEAGIAAFTPAGPQGATSPVVSPFFADVDTRAAASGVMYLRTTPEQIIVTWDQVGYYDANDDKLNGFQLVVRGPDYVIPAGEGAIGFFWKDMQWETGDASGGSGGFGGTEGAVGFGDGASNGFVLDGSTEAGIAGVVRNHRIWFNADLTPICGVPGTPACPTVVPEPGSLALLGLGLAGLAALRRRRA